MGSLGGWIIGSEIVISVGDGASGEDGVAGGKGNFGGEGNFGVVWITVAVLAGSGGAGSVGSIAPAAEHPINVTTQITVKSEMFMTGNFFKDKLYLR